MFNATSRECICVFVKSIRFSWHEGVKMCQISNSTCGMNTNLVFSTFISQHLQKKLKQLHFHDAFTKLGEVIGQAREYPSSYFCLVIMTCYFIKGKGMRFSLVSTEALTRPLLPPLAGTVHTETISISRGIFQSNWQHIAHTL